MIEGKEITPNERAWELINAFTELLWEQGHIMSKPQMKECALKAVEFILPVAKVANDNMPAWLNMEYPDKLSWLEYWERVKEEIKNA